VLGAMVFLAVLPWSDKWFPAWIVVVVLAREFLITALRGYVERMGGELSADWFGKVKMFAQCFAIGIVLGMRAFDLETPFWSMTAYELVSARAVIGVASASAPTDSNEKIDVLDLAAIVRSSRESHGLLARSVCMRSSSDEGLNPVP